MGKKTMKNSEEKPSRHKIIGAVASGQIKKQETSGRLTRRQEVTDEDEDEVYRQTRLARKLVKTPIKYSLIPPDQWDETDHLFQKMVDSARQNVPNNVVGLLSGKFRNKLGLPYRSFVCRLLRNIWLKVHWRCLQEDAGVSDEEMAEMNPLHQLKFMHAVNNTHTPSPERSMKVLATEFGLHTPDIITELVEKMVKAFAELSPDDFAKFAKIAHQDAMDHAMALAVQGISIIG